MKTLILIGSSTGGPGHIEKILKALPPTISATIVIAQHMDKMLVPSFANRLNSICAIPVTAIEENSGLPISSQVYICTRSVIFKELASGQYLLENIDNNHPAYNPSVNDLFLSAVPITRHLPVLAVLLTGIGNDGAKGLLSLRQHGALTIAESAETAVVYGMPRSACEIDAAEKVQSLPDIIASISEFGNSH